MYSEAFIKKNRLSKDFFLKATTHVAKNLLGKGLAVYQGSQWLIVQLVEVEAYLGENDPASHSHRGMTKRNWPMFEPGGTCYVYLCYGVNYCMNTSTQKKGVGDAILFRAAKPIQGIEKMAENRGLLLKTPSCSKKLLSGPGKLTKALGITMNHNGLKFNSKELALFKLAEPDNSFHIKSSKRIGIRLAKEKRLRFYLSDSPWLSRKEGIA